LRVSELDSVRGLAAFIVVLHHFWETVLPDQNTFPLQGYATLAPGALRDVAFWISVTPLRLLFSGHAAVGVFFVLSGFALAKSLQNPRQSSYVTFLVRRFFRIYPPFALVILIAAAASWLIQPQAVPGRDWINHYWRAPVTPDLVLGHLTMITTAGYYNSLDSSMWTLVHELRISAAFPLICALALAYPRTVVATALATFCVLSVSHLTGALTAALHPPLLADMLLSWIQTLRYVLFFVLGILVAVRYPYFETLLQRYPRTRKLLWVCTAVLLAIPYTKGYLELCYAVGAFLLLILCLSSTAARGFLRYPAFLWLGKVSYSLYLVHLIILIAAVYLLHNVLPIAMILLLVLVISLSAAELLNRAVEMPSNEIGKRLTTRRPTAVAGVRDFT
jgi:peptidoglycan/LPS O-acetylase OafA/YrhL